MVSGLISSHHHWRRDSADCSPMRLLRHSPAAARPYRLAPLSIAALLPGNSPSAFRPLPYHNRLTYLWAPFSPTTSPYPQHLSSTPKSLHALAIQSARTFYSYSILNHSVCEHHSFVY